MHYKTIVLRLLQQRPALHEQLRQQHRLLATMNRFALELKSRHEQWQARCREAKPDSMPMQWASDALELAIQEFQEHLPSESQEKEDTLLSLELAMTQRDRHTPPE